MNVYKYTNGEWVIDEALTKDIADNDPFGVISITDGTTNANTEYYIFDGKWSQMDFDDTEVNARLDEYEHRANYSVANEERAEPPYNISLAYYKDTDTEIYNGIDDYSRRTVVFLVDGKFTENPFVLDVDKLDSGKELI